MTLLKRSEIPDRLYKIGMLERIGTNLKCGRDEAQPPWRRRGEMSKMADINFELIVIGAVESNSDASDYI